MDVANIVPDGRAFPHWARSRLSDMNVDLARLQFALTSIYHFLFVPVTMGLSFLVAVMQTLWYRSGRRRPGGG